MDGDGIWGACKPSEKEILGVVHSLRRAMRAVDRVSSCAKIFHKNHVDKDTCKYCMNYVSPL